MIDKMINLSISHLEATLKDVPILRIEIEELKERLFILFEENKKHKKELEMLEKEFKHNAFFEIFSRNYRQQRRRIDELKEIIGNNLKEREKISAKIKEKQKRLDHIDARDIRKEIADFHDKRKAVQILMEKLPSNRNNSRFMTDAVRINIENITYDETGSDSVYLTFLQMLKKIKTTISKPDDEYLPNIEYAISKIEDDNHHNTSGFYSIPLKYLYEAIKFAVKDGMITNNPILDHYISLYREYDRKFDQKYGRMLEQMYDNPHSEIGIYDVKKSQDEKEVLQLFENGIKCNSTEGEDIAPSLSDITTISHVNAPTFLDIISHHEDDCQGFVVLQVPAGGIRISKSNIKITIWGIEENSDGTLSNNYYFLPKYMKGFAKYNVADEEGGIVIYADRTKFLSWRKYNKQLYDGSFGSDKEIRVIREESIEK